MLRTHRLPDGRTLEWMQAGDACGEPVVFFHGYLGSVHQLRLGEELLRRYGLRCIGVNRPGVGSSSPHRYAAMADHVPDVLHLLDTLGIREFSACGISLGAGYALACGALAPRRTRFIAAASMLPPADQPGLLPSMHPLRRTILAAGQTRPLLMETLAWSLLTASRAFPGAAAAGMRRLNARLLPADVPAPDRLLDILDRDIAAIFSSGARCGMTQDLRLAGAWGFRPEDVAAPVVLWHGEDDTVVPAAAAERFARRLPHGELRLRPGGHFMLVPALADVLDAVARRHARGGLLPQDASDVHRAALALPVIA